MTCCGERPTAVLTERHRLRVRYLGGPPIAVTGPMTGADYRFSGRDRLQLVDPRDAVIIGRNRQFRLESVVEVGDDTKAST